MTTTKPGHSHNLLLISENSPSLQSLGDFIEAQGYPFRSVESCDGALDAIRRSNFDLIVLRVGPAPALWNPLFDFVREKRNQLPIIALCDAGLFGELSNRLNHPNIYPLVAPYNPLELEKTIKEVLNQRRIQFEVSTLQERIKQSEKMHRFLVNNSPDIIYILNERGEINFINDRVEKLLNVSKEELIGKHFSNLMSEEECKQHPYVFNERRAVKRVEQRSELHLRKRLYLNGQDKSTSLSMPFEISAMGIYEIDRRNSKPQFRGTYGIARDITDRKQAESLMRFQAYHDLLTGLPNRTLFRDRLSLAISHSKRNGSKVAVMFVDLDRFKLINDSLGHSVGDQLIQAVARRCSEILREGDTLSRFGGDEFTLLLPNIRNQDDAVIIAKKILHELKQPFFIEKHELYVSGSIGIALYPDHGEQIEQLIQNADIAMYHIKGHGKNGYQFFNEKMNQSYAERLHTEQDLRQCVEGEQLFLEYQPIYNVQTSGVYALEAYVRWDHPQRGVLTPAQFLSVAEETGIIVEVGSWVMNRVCADLEEWANPILKIAVNFSPRQVEHAEFENMLMSAVKAHNVSPNQIELEITEELLMTDLNLITTKLKRLNRLGFSISVDDFGTGYSSLSCLHQLPINTIKLHESFLRHISDQYQSGDACIVSAISAMASGLNLNLVAEGVETQQQKDYLVNMGCNTMQGHLFQVPVSSAEARKIVVAPVLTD
ncbi:EAL domain-containing protein [Ketobacter sp.]|uniref:EAL domain-containing protein n=1 Tax=Ketobacter sp. TaxID=2083498 RepID=UPI000F2D367D|nr:EAL domain-containing protein [Ketobacter sp.]RLT98064.1 MAG: EAL domain-containing protein [Ketobacter sp.]